MGEGKLDKGNIHKEVFKTNEIIPIRPQIQGKLGETVGKLHPEVRALLAANPGLREEFQAAMRVEAKKGGGKRKSKKRKSKKRKSRKISKTRRRRR
jgi:hypothetical protein